MMDMESQEVDDPDVVSDEETSSDDEQGSDDEQEVEFEVSTTITDRSYKMSNEEEATLEQTVEDEASFAQALLTAEAQEAPSASRAKPKKESHKKKKPAAAHPLYNDMIIEAIEHLNDPNGASREAIRKVMEDKHEPKNLTTFLNKNLAKMVADGKLKHSKKFPEKYIIDTQNAKKSPVKRKRGRPKKVNGPPTPKKAEKAEKKPKAAAPAHPPLKKLIMEAIEHLDDPNGASRKAIRKFIENILGSHAPKNLALFLNKNLAKMVAAGKLNHPKKFPGKYVIDKPVPTHPLYKEMIMEAIEHLNDPNGASREAIRQVIEDKHAPKNNATFLSKNLANMVADGKLKHSKKFPENYIIDTQKGEKSQGKRGQPKKVKGPPTPKKAGTTEKKRGRPKEVEGPLTPKKVKGPQTPKKVEIPQTPKKVEIPPTPKKAGTTEKKRGRPKKVKGPPTPMKAGTTEKKRRRPEEVKGPLTPKKVKGPPTPKKAGTTEKKRKRGRGRSGIIIPK